MSDCFLCGHPGFSHVIEKDVRYCRECDSDMWLTLITNHAFEEPPETCDLENIEICEACQ